MMGVVFDYWLMTLFARINQWLFYVTYGICSIRAI